MIALPIGFVPNIHILVLGNILKLIPKKRKKRIMCRRIPSGLWRSQEKVPRDSVKVKYLFLKILFVYVASSGVGAVAGGISAATGFVGKGIAAGGHYGYKKYQETDHYKQVRSSLSYFAFLSLDYDSQKR